VLLVGQPIEQQNIVRKQASLTPRVEEKLVAFVLSFGKKN
jgi:hypothetical protein